MPVDYRSYAQTVQISLILHAATAKFRSITFFWITILVILVGVTSYQVSSLVQQLNSHPVLTSVTVLTQPTKPFPAVTICSLNPYKRSALEQFPQFQPLFEVLDTVQKRKKRDDKVDNIGTKPVHARPERASNCPTGFVHHYLYPDICYTIIPYVASFASALSDCQSKSGSTLPIFKSLSEYDSYRQLMFLNASATSNMCRNSYWLGVSLANASQWLDGTAVTLPSYWQTPVANNNCTVHRATGGIWRSVPCSLGNADGYVCQYRLNNNTEQTNVTTNNGCPSGWFMDSYGICYLYVSTPATWDCAEAYCESLGTTLPRFNNDSERNSFNAILPAMFIDCSFILWLGFWSPTGNDAQWINGSFITTNLSYWYNNNYRSTTTDYSRGVSYGWNYNSVYYAFPTTMSATYLCQMRPSSNPFNTVMNTVFTPKCFLPSTITTTVKRTTIRTSTATMDQTTVFISINTSNRNDDSSSLQYYTGMSLSLTDFNSITASINLLSTFNNSLMITTTSTSAPSTVINYKTTAISQQINTNTTRPSTSSTMVDEMATSKNYTSTTVKRLASTAFPRFLTNVISKSLYPSNALSSANGTSVIKNSPTTGAMLTSVKNSRTIAIHTTTMLENTDSIDNSSPFSTSMNNNDPNVFTIDQIISILNLKDNHDDLAQLTAVQSAIPYIAAQIPLSIRLQLSNSLTDFLLHCRFDGTICTEKDFVTWNDPGIGNCFTFNHKNGSQQITQNAGSNYGLDLVFNATQNDLLPSTESNGFIVFTAYNQDTVFPNLKSFVLPPNSILDISLEYKQLQRLSTPYGDCISQKSVLNYFYEDQYSAEGCLITCYQKLVLSNCGCGDPNYPLPPISPQIYNACGLEKKPCVDSVSTSFSKTNQYCSCGQPCLDHVFEAIASLTKTRNFLKLNENQSVALINVYHQKMIYVSYQEVAAYDLRCLFIDFSNAVSILLGMAFQSLFEIIAIVCLMLYACICAPGKKNENG